MALSCALLTSSPNDWIHFSLGRAIERFGASTLAFLAIDPASLRLPVDVASLPRNVDGYWIHGTFLVSGVPAERLPAAVREIESLLGMAESEPSRWGDVFPDGWSADTIREELHRSTDLLADREGAGDGDHPLSVFSFLKGLRALLLKASAAGWPIAHLRFVEISGR